MSDPNSPRLAIRRVHVRIRVGEHMLAATDDPVFLCLRGPSAREFRVDFAHGKSFRRGADDRYVFGPPDDSEVNVAHPELNDPNVPPLDAAGIDGVLLRKGFEPIPNVRALGEMDDRLEIVEAEVRLEIDGANPRVYRRAGPVWLGLVCGLRFELAPVDDPS